MRAPAGLSSSRETCRSLPLPVPSRESADVKHESVHLSRRPRLPSMLITRTPLRISIGGGGTDLPSFYERFGGFVIAGAINRYIYVSINRTFTDDYFLKY